MTISRRNFLKTSAVATAGAATFAMAGKGLVNLRGDKPGIALKDKVVPVGDHAISLEGDYIYNAGHSVYCAQYAQIADECGVEFDPEVPLEQQIEPLDYALMTAMTQKWLATIGLRWGIPVSDVFEALNVEPGNLRQAYTALLLDSFRFTDGMELFSKIDSDKLDDLRQEVDADIILPPPSQWSPELLHSAQYSLGEHLLSTSIAGWEERPSHIWCTEQSIEEKLEGAPVDGILEIFKIEGDPEKAGVRLVCGATPFPILTAEVPQNPDDVHAVGTAFFRHLPQAFRSETGSLGDVRLYPYTDTWLASGRLNRMARNFHAQVARTESQPVSV